ncbi:MAG: cytochrome c [Myxococcales bacterium]|nr:cytochrome c [Myxococcales bacterium]
MKYLLSTLLCAALLTACGEDPSSLPEWTPADHAQPPSLQDPAGRAPARREASVDLARTLYMLHCASCHGAGGKGDGPLATGLTVPDLTAAATREKPDEALVEKIRLGGAGMPAFGGTIPPDGMQAIVAYLRGLSPAED